MQAAIGFEVGQMPYQLRVFGSVDLVNAEKMVSIPSQKSRALLVLLAASPRFVIRRSRAASLLWSGSEEKSRLNLRQELVGLRRALGDTSSSVLWANDQEIGLEPQGFVDFDQFLTGVRATDIPALSQALALFRGPLGSDLDLTAEEFGSWLAGERTRTTQLAVAAGDRLVRLLIAEGRHQEALERAHWLHALDPLREETHRLVIGQEAVVSGRASAMARYEEFRTLLRDELAVQPEPATRHLLDELRSARAAPLEADTPLPTTRPEPGQTDPVGRSRGQLARKPMVVAALAAMIGLILILFGPSLLSVAEDPRRASSVTRQNQDGVVSLAILPFQTAPNNDHLAPFAEQLGDLIKRSFVLQRYFAVIDVPTAVAASTPIVAPIKARYVMAATVQALQDDKIQVFIKIHDNDTGEVVGGRSIVREKGDEALLVRQFGSEILLSSTQTIALHRVREFRDDDESLPALVGKSHAWAVRATQSQRHPQEREVWNRLLQLAPDNEFVLTHIAMQLSGLVARNQSDRRQADLAQLADLLERLRHIAPQSVQAEFLRGLTAKMHSDFEVAERHFARTLELWPGHVQASVQLAHVSAFIGKAEGGLALLDRLVDRKTITAQTIDNAFIAGEVALLADRPKDAVEWLALAVHANPRIGRIQAMFAAALELNGQTLEATRAAGEAYRLSPNYTPQSMAARGNRSGASHPDVATQRQRYVAAFSAALARAKNSEATTSAVPTR